MSDNHYRHDVDTEANHHEPQMMNLSLNQIKERSMHDSEKSNEVARNVDNLKTTETDMGFEYFANKEKMVPEDEVKYYDKKLYGQSTGSGYNDLNNYIKTDVPPVIPQTAFPDPQSEAYGYDPKPSNYGPSFGSGPSNVETSRSGEFANEEEELLAKLDMLRKLGELTTYGVKLSQNYHMKSDYKSMKYEYELHRSIRDKQNGVKWLSNMMINACWGIELGNDHFNPFDFKLKGWSDQVNEDQADYYDVFGELYEKWFKSGKPIPPEIKLFFMLSGSAIRYHLASTQMNSLPNIAEVMNKNPSLADKLRQQAASDKIKEQNSKQREAFNNVGAKQHEDANQKASDIQMLKEKQQEYERMKQNMMHQDMMQKQQMEFMMQQKQAELMQRQAEQLMQRQQQLDDLEMRLQAQMSDNRSAYSKPSQKVMNPPKRPTSLRGLGTQQSPQQLNKTQHEYLRNQQIEQQKRQMRDQELRRLNEMETVSHDGRSVVNINPNLNSIIDEKINDDHSKIDEISNNSQNDSGDGSQDSKVQVTRRRRVKKKPNIKIDV